MLSSDFWHFVDANISDSPSALRLKYHGKSSDIIDYPLAITQIECRQKFGKKLAETLRLNPKFIFPSVLAGEQATSDRLASFHARMVETGSNRIIDLTAGLGIDVFHFAAIPGATVTAIEKDADRYAALEANAQAYSNITLAHADCSEAVKTFGDQSFDYVFIDPARRSQQGGRVFAISDCQPDLTALYPEIKRIGRRLIAKLSPMLDITKTASEIPGIEKIIVLGTPTECKELIAIATLNPKEGEQVNQSFAIEAITLLPDGRESSLSLSSAPAPANDSYASVPVSGQYVFEPYPACMKAAPFLRLDSDFDIQKISANTHLYIGSNPDLERFPGEIFHIEKVLPYESKHIKRLGREYPRICVTTRNFDMTADALRKKLGVKDGGSQRLFAVTLANGQKYMIITSTNHPK